MLQLSPQSRIFLATEPVDFRKGIDGLCAVCRQALGDNPLEGAVYVFRNRFRTALKPLCCGTATPKGPRWLRIGDAWPKARLGSLHTSRATTPPGPQRPQRGALATPLGTPTH